MENFQGVPAPPLDPPLTLSILISKRAETANYSILLAQLPLITAELIYVCIKLTYCPLLTTACICDIVQMSSLSVIPLNLTGCVTGGWASFWGMLPLLQHRICHLYRTTIIHNGSVSKLLVPWLGSVNYAREVSYIKIKSRKEGQSLRTPSYIEPPSLKMHFGYRSI